MSSSEVFVPIPKPHDGQLEALKQFKRFTVLANGRRWGKSLLCERQAALAALHGLHVAYIAPNYQMVSSWWRNMITRLGGASKHISNVHHKMTLYSGGSISCFSMDAPNSIRGNSFDVVWIDEAAFAPNLKDVWDNVIRPTLLDRRGKARFISSPNGFNDFWSLAQNQDSQDDWVTIQMPTWTNPYIPKDEIEIFKRQMPSWVYDAEIGAQFVEMKSGLFRKDWIKKLDIQDIPGGLDIYFGVDLAISKKDHADFTCIAALAKDHATGCSYLLGLHRSRMSMSETISQIKQMSQYWNPVTIAIETVAYQRAIVDEILETTELPVQAVTPKGDKVQRALPLAAAFEHGDIYLADSALVDPELYNELTAFPSTKMHDDCIDAVALALLASVGQQNIFAFSI